MSAGSGFDMLHRAVQRRLWEMRWTALRPIQDRAIEHILGGRGDCIVTAPTAGGKTEAAFLPILSVLADDPGRSVRALYVGPLKALLNDQFRRIEDLCARMEMPVHRWHGDVGQGPRRALLARPSGVLLITPESIEAMFVLRSSLMPGLFSDLSFLVVDELHAFLGSARGAQLLSQFHRLADRCGCDPVRVGLSATLGDPAAACAWLRPGGRPATLLADQQAQRGVAIRVKAVWRDRSDSAAADDDGEDPGAENDALDSVARAILRSCHSATNLVFANAKSMIEDLADRLKKQADAMGLGHEVLVHHGSLAKEQREYTETRLRDERPATAVCSNTLELGIDIGEVDNVVQVSAPWSVTSLAQRLGRSGRREGGTAVLRAFLCVDRPGPRSTVWDGLHLDFLRAVAMIELLLERFCEPADTGRLHLSTLVHQLLAGLAETGGMPADRLYRRLANCGAFGRVTPAEFAMLLRHLAAMDLVAQMEEGDLVLGTRGQRLCDHFSFYAAFASPEEFRVLSGATEIGRLPASSLPRPGDHLLLGGRRWLVEEIVSDRREVHVVPAKGRKKPWFRSTSTDIHPAVHGKMFALACGAKVPPYLDDVARDVLACVRQEAAKLRAFRPRLQEKPGVDRTMLFLWAGSRIHRTLFLALHAAGFAVEDHEIGLEIGGSLRAVRDALGSFVDDPGDGSALAWRAEHELAARMTGDKFDWALPDDLWQRAFVVERLALAESVECVRSNILGEHTNESRR